MTKNEFYKQWLEHFAVGIPPKDLKKYSYLFTVLSQKKAHICLPRQCVLFSTK